MKIIWPRPTKFWYKKRQSMLFKEKLISDHENKALGYNSLILFFSWDWWLCSGPTAPNFRTALHLEQLFPLISTTTAIRRPFPLSCSLSSCAQLCFVLFIMCRTNTHSQSFVKVFLLIFHQWVAINNTSTYQTTPPSNNAHDAQILHGSMSGLHAIAH